MKLTQLVVAIAVLLAACTKSKTETEYVAAAKAHYNQGEYAEATVEIKNALELNGENSSARMLLAQLHLKTGNPAAAEKELYSAYQLGIPKTEILLPLSQALLQQGKYTEVIRLSADSLQPDVKTELLAAQGLASLAILDSGEASKFIDQGIALNPESPAIQTVRARLELSRKQFGEARQILDKLLASHPDHGPAWSLLGELESYQKYFEKAESAYTRALGLSSGASYFSDLLKRAEVRTQLKNLDAAQQDLDLILKQFPQHPLANFSQGQVYLAGQKIDEAIASFEKVERVRPNYAPVLLSLAVAHYQKGNFKQSEQYGFKFLFQEPESTEGARLLGIILFQNGNLQESENQLRKVIAKQPDDALALQVLSSVLFKAGKTDEAVRLLDQIAAQFPDSPYAQTRLGAGLIAKGQLAAGEEKLKEALALDADFHQAEAMLIYHYIAQKNYDQAMLLARSYRDKRPDVAMPRNLIGQIAMHQMEFELAEQSFKDAAQLHPGDIPANTSLAILAMRNKQSDQARTYFQEILKYNTDHYRTLMSLAEFEALQGQDKAMLGYLNRAMTAWPDQLTPRIIMARYHLRLNEVDKAIDLFQGLTQQVSANPEALSIIGTAQLAANKPTDARITLLTLEELKPDSAEVQYLLARAYAGEKKWPAMEKALRRAIVLRPAFFDARLSLASFLVNSNPQEAMIHLQQLKTVKPDDPQVVSLEAVVQNKLGDPQDALTTYQQAFAAVPQTQNLILLVRQHIFMKNREQALMLLEEWMESHPNDLRAALFLGNEYMVQSKPAELIVSHYRKILDIDPENTVALNNLAWTLRDQAPEKALEYAARAALIKPNSASILDTLAVLRLKNGLPDEAKEAIRKARLLAPHDPGIRYHAAMVDHAIGDTLAAAEQLRKLLEEESDFADRKQAEELYRAIQ